MTGETPLVEARALVRHFPGAQGVVRAVDGVDLAVGRQETVGLVGESGCGKSTFGRALLRLQPITSGRVLFDGRDITTLRGEQLRSLRRSMQMIFQDPLASLNPRMRVGDIVAEPLGAHGLARGSARRDRVAELFDLVALPARLASRYPAQLSGGERQRVSIARTLAVDPRFVVADEAVASLDVSVAAQVINLLADLRYRLGLSYLFISHDLSMVRHISDRVAVMYLGTLVEVAPTRAVFEDPQHPYTVALLSASPGFAADGERRTRIVLAGDPPSPVHPPSGCRFHTRCQIGPTVHHERRICVTQAPELRKVGDGHLVACHFAGQSQHVEIASFAYAGDPDGASRPAAARDLPVELAGQACSVHVEGHGPPMLLLHGLLGDREVARLQAPDGFRVATFDQRGHGSGPRLTDPAAYGIEHFVDDALVVLDALRRGDPAAGWTTPIVVGMSMGAAIALRLAFDHPERVGRLVLLGPAFDGEVSPGAVRELAMADAIERDGLGGFATALFARFDEAGAPGSVRDGFGFARSDAAALVAAIRVVSRWAPFPDLDRAADLPMPVGIVAWPDDELHPIRITERLASLLGVHPVMLDGVGTVLARPRAVAGAIAAATTL